MAGYTITVKVDTDEDTLGELVGAIQAQAEEAADDWPGTCTMTSIAAGPDVVPPKVTQLREWLIHEVARDYALSVLECGDGFNTLYDLEREYLEQLDRHLLVDEARARWVGDNEAIISRLRPPTWPTAKVPEAEAEVPPWEVPADSFTRCTQHADVWLPRLPDPEDVRSPGSIGP